MSILYGGIRQVGYVVRDIELAMRMWSETLGVGPWFYNEEVETTEFSYFGQPSRKPRLSIALANSGDMQLELVQPRDDAPSLYRDSLARSGEIAQHVAYWTVDGFDDISARLLANGYVEGHAGRLGLNRGRFAYFIHARLPSAMIELSEMTGGKAEYFESVRQAALGWDGSDPIRRVRRGPAPTAAT